MKCHSCGNEIRDDAQFCTVCGTKMVAAPVTQPVANAPVQPQPWIPPHGQPGVQYVCTYAQHPTMPGSPQIVYVRPKVRGRGFGITAMVLGIIGLLYVFCGVVMVEEGIRQFSNILGNNTLAAMKVEYTTFMKGLMSVLVVFGVMPLLALIFGICSRVRGYKNGISMSGLIMGSVGLFLVIIEMANLASKISMV